MAKNEVWNPKCAKCGSHNLMMTGMGSYRRICRDCGYSELSPYGKRLKTLKKKGKWAIGKKPCLNCGSTFGNCSQCNRCNACHQNAGVEHSCAWRRRKKEKELKAQDPYRRTWTERQRNAQRDARSKRKMGY